MIMEPDYPCSCDTFVAFPPATKDGEVIFGKNSDRPSPEVQEMVFQKQTQHEEGSLVNTTYLKVPQIPLTYAVALSKPAWCWGAEMGINESGVCIGNEAIWTKGKTKSDYLKKALLGMDLVRLGLERSQTASQALGVITTLLGEYGQGGSCSEDAGFTEMAYHNSFLIVDAFEAWVLETAGLEWAAEKVTAGVRNISNQLSIHTTIDRRSSGLFSYAEEMGLWSKESGLDFDFADIFGLPPPTEYPNPKEDPRHRLECGKKLMGHFLNDSRWIP